jgi:hypothetical protein
VSDLAKLLCRKQKLVRLILTRLSTINVWPVTFACRAGVSTVWVNRALDLNNPLPSRPHPKTRERVLRAAQRTDESLRGTRHEGLTPSLYSLFDELFVSRELQRVLVNKEERGRQ